MRLSAIASFVVVGVTLAGNVVLTPPHPQAKPAAFAAVLPLTGAPAAGLRIHQAVEIDQPQAPIELYSEYVPPPPTPAPAPVAADWSGYVTIPVPIYQQAMVLDCETGALRMGLATFGRYYSDSALFAYENPDTRMPLMGPNHTVVQWGDPYTNFVGYVNGSDYTPTGYGVYYPVIVAIAQSHGLPNAYGGQGFAPSTVYAALAARHPVEIWIETNWARPRLGTWTAWDGRQVRYSLVEHAVILSGVSPTMVRVNDPLHGTQYWVSKWEFETVWRDFDNMAVIFQ